MSIRARWIAGFLFAAVLLSVLLAVPLTWQGKVALAATAAVFGGLWIRPNASIEMLFLGGLMIVTLGGVIEPQVAFGGFAEPAVLTIAALFVCTAALRSTGVLDVLGDRLLGSALTERGALVRMALFVPTVSSVVLNTPLVAMLAPMVVDWCRKRQISPSRLLIPLSYLAILGGVCTLIGTTTTLVVNSILPGLAADNANVQGLQELGFLEVTAVGVPCAIVGTLYMVFVAPRLLPNRTDLIEQLEEGRREYLLEMLVQPSCPLVGKTVEEAGLRSLPGLYLIEINRDDQAIAPVTPDDVIAAHDRMVFTGVVTTIADLERIPGLVPAADLTYEFHPAQRTRRHLTEAVLSRSSPIVGKTVRQANFRRHYGAAVVAVHRDGERVSRKIGDIRLEAGDTLLLQTRTDFVEAHRNDRDFYLVSQVGGSSARRHDRAVPAAILFALLICWLSACSLIPQFWPQFEIGHLFAKGTISVAAITIAITMIGIRCVTAAEARRAIDIQVIVTIAAAIGLGRAMFESGAAEAVANSLVNLVENVVPAGVDARVVPYLLLVVVYLLAMLCTEAITNVAVANIMLPIAIEVAVAGGVAVRPFVMAIAVAASLSFITPVGYQTNLMVMGPGGYQPGDFARVGTPLALLAFITSIVVIPIIWPF